MIHQHCSLARGLAVGAHQSWCGGGGDAFRGASESSLPPSLLQQGPPKAPWSVLSLTSRSLALPLTTLHVTERTLGFIIVITAVNTRVALAPRQAVP